MITRDTPVRLGLTFDDVLLVPQRTRATSRSLVDLSTTLSPEIRLHLPLISANAPFCTEGAMAIGMALAGGMGFVHRMTSIERERDAVHRTKQHRFAPERFPHATCDGQGRLRVGAAVGVKGDYLARAEAMAEAGADLLVVDIAHGHADYALAAISELAKRFPSLGIAAGNVATATGTRDLIGAGAQVVKVGIGPGSICTTRLVTGAGVPQLTAVLDCVAVARPHGVAVIADGGLRTSGDITKALAAGASAAMLGGMLAGADESAGTLVERGGRRYKATTGFASLGVELTLKRLAGETIDPDELAAYVPEGVEATFPHRGPLANLLLQIAGGMRSGFSYSGAMSLPELWDKAELIRTSEAGRAENRPHALEAEGPRTQRAALEKVA